MEEQWRAVVGFEGLYEVSDHGRVRSLPRQVQAKTRWGGYRTLTLTSRILDGWAMGNCNHWYVGLYQNSAGRGNKETRAIHRLVLEAFVGPCPVGMEGCHWDGDPSNNRLTNLRWDTYKANQADRERHGRHARGSASKRAKLTEADIPVIRQMLAEGKSMCSIGKKFGVAAACIQNIRDGKTWKHVP